MDEELGRLAEKHGLGRQEHPETPQAILAHPVTARTDYRTSLLTTRAWYENGAWLDQGNTGTCVANAAAHRLADGPIRQPGIDENFARQLYLNATGDSSLQQGTSALTICRYMLAQGMIESFDWVTSPEEFDTTMLSIGSIMIGIPWFYSQFRPVLRFGHPYLNVDQSSGLAGYHEVLINRIQTQNIDSEPPWYRLKNSWGQNWSGSARGTVRVSKDDLMSLVFGGQGDAVVLQERRIR